jgi:hypothetical protein
VSTEIDLLRPRREDDGRGGLLALTHLWIGGGKSDRGLSNSISWESVKEISSSVVCSYLLCSKCEIKRTFVCDNGSQAEDNEAVCSGTGDEGTVAQI